MTELSSATVPRPEPGVDHLRGSASAPLVVLYMDLACPACAASWLEIRALPLHLCVRHFPIKSKRPRSPALHTAAEAAASPAVPGGGEEAFNAFWDSLYEDRGRVDDPHLWERAERLGLDVGVFEEARRSGDIGTRVKRDFNSGIRAGVTGTPAAFVAGKPVTGDVTAALRKLAGAT